MDIQVLFCIHMGFFFEWCENKFNISRVAIDMGEILQFSYNDIKNKSCVFKEKKPESFCLYYILSFE